METKPSRTLGTEGMDLGGVCIYTRVSSRKQDQRSQMHDLDAWCKAKEVTPPHFHDSQTGKTMDRPGFNLMMERVRAGTFKKIVVWRLDRLGRTAKGILELCEELQKLGVTLVSLKEGIDLSTPAGRLLIAILASMAQFETEVRSERQRAGIDAAKARGKKWGGSKKGARKLKKAICDKIASMRTSRFTIPQIARAVEISERSVRNVLKTRAQ